MSMEPYQIVSANSKLWILNGSLTWRVLLLEKAYPLKLDPKSLKASVDYKHTELRTYANISGKEFGILVMESK